ncbi:hypothetical protein HNO89_003207 [Sporosarcina luteola]|nr:hypothetical protein [Sporosarcina luteola]
MKKKMELFFVATLLFFLCFNIYANRGEDENPRPTEFPTAYVK